MGFVAICTAAYDYKPQSEGELEIKEGELLYILEQSTEDDWWKARKKAAGEDEDEPEGLIPNNYVEEAKPIHTAKALYDYTRQTDEEVSFAEDASLDVFDTSDPDWTLVRVNDDFGFAPANYIEISGSTAASPPPSVPALPKSPSVSSARRSLPPSADTNVPSTPSSPAQSIQTPAANLARVLGGGVPRSPTASRPVSSPRTSRPQQQLTPEASDGETEEAPPALPQRPPAPTARPAAVQPAPYRDYETAGVLPSPPYNRATPRPEDDEAPIRSAGGFHLYNINEMVSAMGRRRKMPITLGINIATGTIMLSPEKSRDGPSQEWRADKMTHYSIEGKHVFMELIRPSKSLDLHAGAKDTAEEIVAALGEIAGAQRAEGIREVMAAAAGGGGQKKGQVLYDFVAQGDDEVTVAVGDEVIILDDTKSEEWWNVRRLKNGKEGVMPSSYIEVTGALSIEPPSRSGVNAGRSTVEQNRLEEERLAKEAVRASRGREEAEQATSRPEVGPGMQLPQRGSSLGDEHGHRSARRDDRDKRKSRSKPDPAKTRTWTDHSGTFKVEAQFIGLADGKIHLHKVNGVKIAVPVTKMSAEDLEYVEKVTHESIEDHIPVADLVKMKRRSQASDQKPPIGASTQAEQAKVPPEYDWFDFFLKAGVGPHQCERYSQAMIRDSMDESVLPDITHDTLRTLGLKEGDALKVMKYLDQRFSRSRAPITNGVSGDGAAGGLFSGPGGALHNNTRRGRPETSRQTSDIVDADAFKHTEGEAKLPADAKATPLTRAPAREPQPGFEDDAWTIKQPTKTTTPSEPAPAATSTPKPPTGALAELALLDEPLKPTPAATPAPPVQQPAPQPQPQAVPAPAPVQAPAPAPAAISQPPQQTGANPAFFSQLNQQPALSMQPPPQIQAQATGLAQIPQFTGSRQRPPPPQQSFTGTGLLPPPPRPTSAPHNVQQNQFGLQPLQPQLTGFPRTSVLQAPPGQTLNDLTQQRLQQQYNQFPLPAQPTGYQPNQSFGQVGNTLPPQPTGFQPQQFGQFQQPYLNGNAASSPFADPRPAFQPQPTGLPSFQQGPLPTGINSVLPPALQPQKTGFASPLQQVQTNGFTPGFPPPPLQPQPTGFLPSQPLQPQPTGFGPLPQQNGFTSFSPPPVPPIPQQPTIAPLQPQKTGPAPNVKFGVTEAKKLIPQPTGRRANLAHASESLFQPHSQGHTNFVHSSSKPFRFLMA